MLDVLNTQLYRLKRSKLFWWMFGVCGVLPLLGMLLTTGLFNFLGAMLDDAEMGLLEALRAEGGGVIILSSLGGFSSLSSNPALFSVIASSIFLSGEFSDGPIRNMILANKSRTQIFLSFLSISLIIGFSCLAVAFVSSLTFYGIAFGFAGVTATEALNGIFSTLFLAMISVAFAQACVCMFLFVTRKTGGTVAFPILVIILLPSIVTGIVEMDIAMKALVGEVTVDVQALAWIPLYNVELFDAANVDGALVGKIALYNAPIAALFAFFGWLAISKADLK